MATSSRATTPSDLLRSELERIGGAAEGVPDDLTWDQATDLARSILVGRIRSQSPKVAELIDAGDFNAAAAGFMATLQRGHLRAKQLRPDVA